MAVAIAVAFVGTPVNADEASPTEVQDPEEVVINGRTYGPEEGLVVETGEIALPRQNVTSEGLDSGARALARFTKGSSYVSSSHPSPLKYVGRARAYGNLYQSRRVIRSSFVYRRDGKNVIAWQHGNARVSSSCNWSAGPEKVYEVWDSLNPSAPVTTFHFSFMSVDRRVC